VRLFTWLRVRVKRHTLSGVFCRPKMRL
jgi:hypothetical protein